MKSKYVAVFCLGKSFRIFGRCLLVSERLRGPLLHVPCNSAGVTRVCLVWNTRCSESVSQDAAAIAVPLRMYTLALSPNVASFLLLLMTWICRSVYNIRFFSRVPFSNLNFKRSLSLFCVRGKEKSLLKFNSFRQRAHLN